MTFKYTRWEIANAEPLIQADAVYRPMVPLGVWGTDTILAVAALVDSGADHTLLPMSIAQEANVTVDETTTTVRAFGGGPLTAHSAHVDLELSDGRERFHWVATVGFVEFSRPSDEVAILGHGAFLDYFRVTFDPWNRQVTISTTSKFTGGASGADH